VPELKEAADWYSKVFKSRSGRPDQPRRRAFPFGKKDDQPYGVTAQGRAAELPDHPHAQRQCATTPGAPRPRPKAQATIDHIGYTVADFNRDRAKAALTAMGVKNLREAGRYSLNMDDPFGYDVQISGLEGQCAQRWVTVKARSPDERPSFRGATSGQPVPHIAISREVRDLAHPPKPARGVKPPFGEGGCGLRTLCA